MFMGSLGEPPGGWPPHVQQIVLKGKKPISGRPGESIPPTDLGEAKSKAEAKVGHSISRTDLMSYLMYPEVYTQFDAARQNYSDVSVLPTPVFYYGIDKGEEITVEIEEGKTLIIKFLTVGEPHPDGTRTVFYELNGQPREVTVIDRSLKVDTAALRQKADPSKPGHVAAPIPGAISSVAVEVGEHVEKGARLLVMEAMKMQTTVYAPIAGTVKELLVSAGQTVESKDLLAVIE
jgi:pyruvate carboxylase